MNSFQPSFWTGVFLSFVLVSQAGAQDASITVTGTRSFVVDPGLPVQTLTAADLAARSGQDLRTLLTSFAGLSLRNLTGGVGTEEPVAAGFGENSQGRVLVLLDGVELNPPDMGKLNWLLIPVSQLESISWIPGSASVIYGDKASGGVLDLRTKTGSKNTAEVTAEGGQFGRRSASLSVHQVLGQDSFRLSGQMAALDGFRIASASSSAGLGLDFTRKLDSLNLKLAGRLNTSEAQLPGSLTEAQFLAGSTAAANLQDSTKDLRGQVRLTLADAKAEVPWNGALGWTGTSRTNDLASYTTKTVSWQDQYEISGLLTVNPSFWPDLSLPLGADGHFTRLDLDRNPGLAGGARHIFAQTEAALYANPSLEWGLATLKAGLRLAQFNRWTEPTASASLQAQTGELVAPASASLHLRLTPEWGLSAGYEGVYHYPLLDEQASYAGWGPDTWNPNLRPERGHSGRLVAEYRLEKSFDLTLGLNGLWVTDEIWFDSSVFANANRTQPVQRLFAVATAAWTNELGTLKAGAQLVDARLTAGAAAGKFVPMVPQATANLRYLSVPLAGLTLDFGWDWQGSQFRGGDDANAQPVLAPRSLFDAGAVWEWEGFKLWLRGTNLTNERWAEAVYYTGWYPGAPRQLWVGASFQL